MNFTVHTEEKDLLLTFIIRICMFTLTRTTKYKTYQIEQLSRIDDVFVLYCILCYSEHKVCRSIDRSGGYVQRH